MSKAIKRKLELAEASVATKKARLTAAEKELIEAEEELENAQAAEAKYAESQKKRKENAEKRKQAEAERKRRAQREKAFDSLVATGLLIEPQVRDAIVAFSGPVQTLPSLLPPAASAPIPPAAVLPGPVVPQVPVRRHLTRRVSEDEDMGVARMFDQAAVPAAPVPVPPPAVPAVPAPPAAPAPPAVPVATAPAVPAPPAAPASVPATPAAEDYTGVPKDPAAYATLASLSIHNTNVGTVATVPFDSDERCPICTNAFDPVNSIEAEAPDELRGIRTLCNHAYHLSCLANTLGKIGKCSVCNMEYVPQVVEQFAAAAHRATNRDPRFRS